MQIHASAPLCPFALMSYALMSGFAVVHHTRSRLQSDLFVAECQAAVVRIPISIVFAPIQLKIEPKSTASVVDTLVQSPAEFTSTQKMYFFHLYF